MKARLIAGMTAALLLAAAMATVGVHDAKALGNYGAAAGADVYCDPTGGIYITAHVGRWAGFTAQDVRFTHALVNIETGATEYLKFANGQYWRTFRHNQPMTYGLPYAPDSMTYASWRSDAATRYTVYTMYSWYDGYWRSTDWVPARYYSHPWGGSGAGYCLTRNPTVSDYYG